MFFALVCSSKSGILWLDALAPTVFLLQTFSFPSAAAAASPLVAPRNINASLIPVSCLSDCQLTISAQSSCGTNLTCLCTPATASSFATCMDCVVSATGATSLAQSAGQGVLSEYTQKCADNGSPVASLSLSLAAAPTGSAVVDTSNSVLTLTRPILLTEVLTLVLAGLLF